MVKMKKHILYIALGLLALIAIITTVLAIGGVVTLPVIGQPAIEQPAVSDSQPHGPTAAEVEALIDALPQPVTSADSIKVLIARLGLSGAFHQSAGPGPQSFPIGGRGADPG